MAGAERSFSGAVQVADVSDFVEPASSCALGLDQGEARPRPAGEAVVGTRESRQGGDSAASSKVQISLQDCLACAGCVTSAETVLLAQQSAPALRELLSTRDRSVGVSVAEASRAALAHSLGTCTRDAALLLRRSLKRRGAFTVCEQAVPAALSRAETLAELREREHSDGPLPLLVSACPGWTCYAEASQHAHPAVPHLSSVKSPTALASELMRAAFDTDTHVTVEPCYDKKLESARPGVDAELSITTSEVLELLREDGFDDLDRESTVQALQEELQTISELCCTEPLNAAALGWRLEGEEPAVLSCAQGGRLGTSGAFALSALGFDSSRLVQKRNADMAEGRTDEGRGIAAVWGLRNVQTLLRQIKKERGKKTGGYAPKWSMVEVMACPSGCLNGGGQPQPRGDTPKAVKAYPEERVRYTQPPEVAQLELGEVAREVAKRMMGVDEIGGQRAGKVLRLREAFQAKTELADGKSAVPKMDF